jgi:hypothetical protein
MGTSAGYDPIRGECPRGLNVNDRPARVASGEEAKLDGPMVAQMLERAYERVAQHQRWLDELNVFPIADADSGRNMTATLGPVAEAMGAAVGSQPDRRPELAVVVAAGERAAIHAARGNSGVILAEWLRGFLSALPQLPAALWAAAAGARGAMDQPVEGTMITVAADAAQDAVGDRVLDVLTSARNAAQASVARTPSLLPVLARHEVVDAGGAGLLCVLDGFVLALGGDAPEQRGSVPSAGAPSLGIDTAEVEVMITVEASSAAVRRIELEWRELGDSIAATGADDLWRLHVHTARPEAAIAVAERLGSVIDRAIEPLAEERP